MNFDIVAIGYIKGAYALDGAVEVVAYNRQEDIFNQKLTWYFAKKPGEWQLMNLVKIKCKPNKIYFYLQDCHERDSAQKYRGYLVGLAAQVLPKLPLDEYYWRDLIGLCVKNKHDEQLGEIFDLIDIGPHCVLKIMQSEQNKEFMIPFTSEHVLEISLQDRTCVVDWEGDWSY